jgi:hypothetical protein
MQPTPSRPRRRTRLMRALGLDRNPLRRASDRTEAWVRIGLLAVFLIAGPITALRAGGWAYHGGMTVTSVQPASSPSATALRPAPDPSDRNLADQAGQAPAGSWRQIAHPSARANDVLAVVIALALMALALLAVQRLTLALLTRRRLAAWEAAWSKVGPQWSRGRP